MVPAAIGGFAAMSITVLAAVPAALCRREAGRERGRRLATVAACAALLSLPWLIPAFAVAVHTDPRGVDAVRRPRGYAVRPPGQPGHAVWHLERADGPARVRRRWLGRLAAGRGRRAGRVPAAGPAPAGGSGPRRRRAGRAGDRGRRRDVARPRGAARPGTAWPGFAVLRDGQQFLAPLALAEAVGLGGLVAWIATGARGRPAGRPRRWPRWPCSRRSCCCPAWPGVWRAGCARSRTRRTGSGPGRPSTATRPGGRAAAALGRLPPLPVERG